MAMVSRGVLTRAAVLVVASCMGPGCTGSISGEVSGPDPDEEIGAERYFLGQSLYDQNCASCHGVFEESAKRGRSAEAISGALGRIPLMEAFVDRVSQAEREHIAYALSQDPAKVVCPPIEADTRAVPMPKVQLVHHLATRLTLPPSAVDTALAGYHSGYETSPVFDNQAIEHLVQTDTASSLLEGMENVARLVVSSNERDRSCVGVGCARQTFVRIASRLGVTGSGAVDAAIAIAREARDLGMPADSLRLGLTRLLMSPQIVFSNMSGSQTGPRATLVAALGSRSIAPEETTTEIEALMNALFDSSAPDVLADRFGLRWLRVTQKIDEIDDGDPSQLPVAPAVLEDFETQIRLTFREWFAENGSLSSLMSSDIAWLNERLASYYGVSGVVGEEFRAVDVSMSRGGGLLSHGGIHLATGATTETSPVTRGHWVLENLLCTSLPPPPDPDEVSSVEEMLKKRAPEHQTPRDKSSARRSVNQCAGCHHVMDEIGFGLEAFDPWGAERATYPNGDNVETEGQLPGPRVFSNHRELEEHLRDSLAFRMCATRKLTTYLVGRPLTDAETCHMRQLAAQLSPDTPARQWLREVVRRVLPGIASNEESQ